MFTERASMKCRLEMLLSDERPLLPIQMRGSDTTRNAFVREFERIFVAWGCMSSI